MIRAGRMHLNNIPRCLSSVDFKGTCAMGFFSEGVDLEEMWFLAKMNGKALLFSK